MMILRSTPPSPFGRKVKLAASVLGLSGEMKTLVPKKAMDELKTLFDSTDAETIEFAKDESTLFFRIGQRLLTSRQLTGQFPNYEAVLPKEVTKSVTVQGDELGSAIARVAQFADERSRAVRLKLEKGELKLSASSTETGESEDSIEVAYTGDPLTIGFNAQYLVDFIKASGAGEVEKMRADWRARLDAELEAGQSYRPNRADWLDGRWAGVKIAEVSDDPRRGHTGVARIALASSLSTDRDCSAWLRHTSMKPAAKICHSDMKPASGGKPPRANTAILRLKATSG